MSDRLSKKSSSFIIIILSFFAIIFLFFYFQATIKPDKNSRHKIIAAIAPHHLLVGEKNIEFLHKFADELDQKAILILPNHHELGGKKFITSTQDYEFWYQYDHSIFSANDVVLDQEESLDTWNQIKRRAQVNLDLKPLLISNYVDLSQLALLEDILIKLIHENYLIIASIDFSHYLSYQQANYHDELTKKIVNDYDLTKILTLDNNYVDSNRILYLMVSLAQQQSWAINWIWHGNSAEKNPLVDDHNTTSYYLIEFTQ